MHIYVVSYFREDKDCNTFFPDQIEKGLEIDLEMYNKTVIYVFPKDRNQDQEFRSSFEIFEAEEFQYGSKYTLITQLISGVGGFILILSVIMYLDGFKEMWKHIKEQREEMKRQKEEQERLQQEKIKNENDGKKAKPKANDRGGDTQRSDNMSEEEDPNYGGEGDNAVHEGGSRAGSREAQRRRL